MASAKYRLPEEETRGDWRRRTSTIGGNCRHGFRKKGECHGLEGDKNPPVP
jgi:hypothetical protein